MKKLHGTLYTLIGILIISLLIFKFVYIVKIAWTKENYYQSNKINSIKYTVLQENYGSSEGITRTKTDVSYVYPQLLRIDKSFTDPNIKAVEIFNNNNYICYSNKNNVVYIKDSLYAPNPEITAISKEITDILKSEKYDFYGYEEIDNLNVMVIGLKTIDENHKYITKYWVAEISGVNLPLREEYIIDGTVVSKSSYQYISINEYIDNSIFSLDTENNRDIKHDGWYEKYVMDIADAKKYVNFKLINPGKLQTYGYEPSAFYIIPPLSNPRVGCILIKDMKSITLIQGNTCSFEENCSIGALPCRYEIKDTLFLITFNINGINVELTGDINDKSAVIGIAENITGSKLSEPIN